ncbi:MAG: hypothetical protein ACN6OL_06565, partial [Stenotrophomonas indicatrix]
LGADRLEARQAGKIEQGVGNGHGRSPEYGPGSAGSQVDMALAGLADKGRRAIVHVGLTAAG